MKSIVEKVEDAYRVAREEREADWKEHRNRAALMSWTALGFSLVSVISAIVALAVS